MRALLTKIEIAVKMDAIKAHLHDKRFGQGTPENEHPCQNSYFAIYLFTRQFFAGTFL